MITRTTDTDDDGTGTTGTIHDNAWLQAIYDAMDARWSRYSYSLTGSQNNVDVDEADLVLITSASTSTLTGLAAPVSPAKPGKVTVFKNTTSNTILFAHNSGSSSVGNKFFNQVTSASTPISTGGWIIYQYDDANSRWALRGHDQGAWITPTFAAGSYTANGSMTWTVGSGDVSTQAYKLSGNSVDVAWNLATTTVGGTPNTNLQITNAAWGGFTATKGITGFHSYVDNAGTEAIGRAFVSASATVISLQKAGLGNWSAATDATQTFGSVRFEVT